MLREGRSYSIGEFHPALTLSSSAGSFSPSARLRGGCDVPVHTWFRMRTSSAHRSLSDPWRHHAEDGGYGFLRFSLPVRPTKPRADLR